MSDDHEAYEVYPAGPRHLEPEHPDGPISFADAVPRPDEAAYVWHVLVERRPGEVELVPGVHASRDEALEQARAQAFGHQPSADLGRGRRQVFRDGSGFVTTFGGTGTGTTTPAIRTRVVSLESED